ncbi:Alpha-mannosidase [Smittium culicis]|uniref:Alpha-mannosidase n=3 Tax=Smittium culicis TaxID=133412 RepID=A0A1R1XXG3_9FUNG|nr:Alpha-mannosidase [Smittium culicis]
MFSSSEYNDTTLQKHQSITKERLRNFIHTGRWDSVNIHSALWEDEISSETSIKLQVYSPPDLARPRFEDAIKNEFAPASVGQKFGPSWSTHWFKVCVYIPDSFIGRKVYFQFDPDCEALVYNEDGTTIQGLTGGSNARRVEHLLTDKASKDQVFNFYIETSCNGLFGVGDGLIGPPNPNRNFELKKASIGVKRQEAWNFLYDMTTIVDMAHHIGADTPRGIGALYTANQMANLFDPERPDDSIKQARKLAAEFLSVKPGEGVHQITAIGNCHIDTAWLWPYDETKRKVARSFTSQIRLMEKYPEFKFAASQAQQFDWLKSTHNDLFNKIRKYVKSGQFIPIGGTWVEMDCNIPNGESLSRQFILGQRFFQEHFGVTSKLFWLPDTFGYAAQIPQIVKQAGGEYFFTQKLSWNNINKFPNTTFNWHGLDGSSILAHMAPANTYTGNAQVNEIVSSVKNHKDLSSHNSSMYLYGYGDGGGGPNEEMIESIRRMSNTDGLPKIEHRDPTEFYHSVKKSARSLPSWHGELYFELHRGTYTSQSNNKKANRKSEFLLRSVELLSIMAMASNNFSSEFSYPQSELDRLWKLVCLNQFHDVIPGSSINEVYRDSDKMYDDIISSSYDMIRNALLNLIVRDPKMCEFDQAKTTLTRKSSQENKDFVLEFTSTSDNLTLIGFSEGSGPRAEDKEWEYVAGNEKVVVINECSWERSGVVIANGLSKASVHCGQLLKPRATLFKNSSSDVACAEELPLVLVDTIPGMGLLILSSDSIQNIDNFKSKSSVRREGDNFILENAYTKATFNKIGQLVSLVDHTSGREFIHEGQTGNNFVMYQDVPLFWDAWDVEIYYLEKPNPVLDITVEIFDNGPLVSSILIKAKISELSTLQQWVSLKATSSVVEFETEVEWRESHKMLKVEFSWAIKSDKASYETQYGYISRPNHKNTSWDIAKFEVCGHKFADLSEYGAGVTLLNDSKYGFSCIGNLMAMSLLRAPKSPDEVCDMGFHSFRYGVYAHNSSFPDHNVVRKGYEFNNDLVGVVLENEITTKVDPSRKDRLEIENLFTLENADSVILDTVKFAEPQLESKVNWEIIKAEEGNTQKIARNFVVLRMYESLGGSTTIHFNTKLNIKAVYRSDMLENIKYEYEFNDQLSCYPIKCNAFEVITIMLELA